MSAQIEAPPPSNEALWKTIFADGHPQLKSFQRLHSWLPSPPRCRMCYAPFAGVGGALMRLKGKGPANRNPRYCSACDKFLRAFPGGAEVELSMMFVDVRGSVALAERLSPAEYSRQLAGFFQAATQALIDTDGFVIDFRGDCVVGVYPPGFTGSGHAANAVLAAQRLLDAVPAISGADALPLGIGVHSGTIYIGTVSGAEGGIQDLTILGDNVNVAARLAQVARPGEALVSETVARQGDLPVQRFEARQVELTGRSKAIDVYVLKSKV